MAIGFFNGKKSLGTQEAERRFDLFVEGNRIDKVLTILLMSLPTLVVVAIVYRRTKRVQVRLCLALAFLWILIGFYAWFGDIESQGYDPPARLVTFPEATSNFLVGWLTSIPFLRILHGLLLPALAYIISFIIIFIIFLPFYVYSSVSNKTAATKQNEPPEKPSENT